MTGDEPASFGDLLRRARRAAGLTQEQLAERAGLSVRGISDLERGARKKPRRDTLELLAEAFDLSEAELDQWSRLRRELARRESGAHSREYPSSEPVGNLPVPLTALIGRDDTVAELSSWIEFGDRRLITVTGPGGVGKTRLAIAVGHTLRESMPDGVWFVDLAPLNQPELVIPAIASTLAISTTGTQSPLDAILDALRRSGRMIVLDNFEQVVDSAPDIVTLLTACPQLSILATSRISLRVQGEREYQLAPLPLPVPDIQASTQDFGSNASIMLFTERAQAVRTDFQILEDNIEVVAEICRRLDGLPLALELAAARIRLLSPQAMLERMEPRLPLLVGARRDAPGRQRTLRATIQWSYDLLDPVDRRLLRALSVFRGGWTLEAAEIVADPAIDILDGLQTLIHHSLVRVREEPDGTARYSMLETVREFGFEQLVDARECDDARRRHAAFFLGFVEEAGSFLTGPDQRTWHDRLSRDYANVQAALEWSIDGDSAPLAVRLAAALPEFWYWQGRLSEGRHWLEGALALSESVKPELRAQAYLDLGGICGDQGDITSAERYIGGAVALFRQAGDTAGLADALRSAGGLEMYRGDYSKATSFHEEALNVARAANSEPVIATVLGSLSLMAAIDADYLRAEALADESLSAYRALEDERGVTRTLGYQAYFALWQGDLERASQVAQEGMTRLLHLNDVELRAFILELLGYVELEREDFQRSSEYFCESVRRRYDLRELMGTAECLEGLAGATTGLGYPIRSAELLGQAAKVREQIHSPVPPPRRARYERTLTAIRDELDPKTFSLAYARGQQMTLGQIVSFSLNPLCGVPQAN